MRFEQLSKTERQIIDGSLCPLIKSMLGLSANTANEYLFGAKEDGLFRIPLSSEDSDIAILDGVCKLLTSKDVITKDMAWAELRDDADFRQKFTRV